MRASHIMAVAVLAFIIGRWAHNKPAVNVQVVVGGAFAIIVVALMDQGESEPVAKGFAWLFLAVALLGPNSPLPAISKAASAKKGTK